MAFSLNKQMIIGNLGKDATTRTTTNNLSVTTFGVATTSGYKDKSGNWVNETTWHNVVAFKLSEKMVDMLKKGTKVYVDGRTTKKEYTDKNGVKKLSVDILAETIIPFTANGSPDTGNSYSSEDSAQPESDDNEDLPF
jgi:single-strand DNA-binding protein